MRTQAFRLGLGVLAFLLPAGAASASGPAPGARSSVQLTLTGQRQPVPRSFFGLSSEANEIATYEDAGPLFDRVLGLIRTADGSPLVLRIGGKSSDDAYWDVPPVGTPPWVFELDGSWLGGLAAIVRRDDLRVMLDLNLAVHSPTMAAQFARAARSALPRGALVGLGVGNEPDLYNHQLGLQRERVATTLSSTPADWAQTYSPSAYRNDYRSYARALTAAVPGVPLDGPDITSSTPRWVSTVAGLDAFGPSLITMHRYPFSTCFKPTSPYYPTIAGLLAHGASTGLARGLRRSLAVAAARGLPLRVTELNSVSCGGNEGVADSFATALWAPDALFELMQGGVVGVNWHIRPALVNAPFHFIATGIRPLPELYGLALFAQMIEPGAQLDTLQIANPQRLGLKAWAVSSRAGLKLLLINKQATAVPAELSTAGLPAERAQLIRLRAPSIAATSGITLAGRAIGADARWHGRIVDETVRAGQGLLRLLVPGYSAELLSFTRG